MIPPGVPSVSVARVCYARPGMFPTKLTWPRLNAPTLEQNMSESFMTIPIPIKTSTSWHQEANNRNSSRWKIRSSNDKLTHLIPPGIMSITDSKILWLEVKKILKLNRHHVSSSWSQQVWISRFLNINRPTKAKSFWWHESLLRNSDGWSIAFEHRLCPFSHVICPESSPSILTVQVETHNFCLTAHRKTQ